jgi:hypothetical protein
MAVKNMWVKVSKQLQLPNQDDGWLCRHKTSGRPGIEIQHQTARASMLFLFLQDSSPTKAHLPLQPHTR